jgi:hypothetical protein
MELVTTLNSAGSEIVAEALAIVERSHVHHYEKAGAAFTRAALDDLLQLVVTAIERRDLNGVIRFAEELAEHRFAAGFDISEVQAAFNALEAATWRQVVATEVPEDLPEAIGLVSTVFGGAKDALARRYVSLASQKHVPSLDLSALFQGTIS